MQRYFHPFELSSRPLHIVRRTQRLESLENEEEEEEGNQRQAYAENGIDPNSKWRPNAPRTVSKLSTITSSLKFVRLHTCSPLISLPVRC